uniref:Uncharacterized protein n=1 Tax=viral metagenome TaxID=1070528 RepID=A0A6C0DIT0_9ZZZZ
MKRYIHIDSGYRDRLTYPNIGDFVVETNAYTLNGPATAKDPIILAFPYESNQLSGGSTTTQITLSVTSSNILNFYRDSYLEINGEFRKIIGYDNTSQIATVDIGFSVAPLALTLYSIRKELPAERSTTSNNATALNKIYLGAGSSSTDNFYVNTFVFLPGGSPPTSYQWKRITAYDGTTKIATVSGIFSSLVTAGTTYEILRFTRDNVVPLNYQGSNTLGNATCENVRLISLIVPNRNILNGYGTLQNYSHVYVEIYSERGNTYSNPIISNAPAAKKALFQVPVTFNPNTSWLTLQGSYMTQNLAFKENDTLHVRITLPTGQVLQFEPYNQFTYFQGYGFPIESDPGTQVQLVLEVTR